MQRKKVKSSDETESDLVASEFGLSGKISLKTFELPAQ